MLGAHLRGPSPFHRSNSLEKPGFSLGRRRPEPDLLPGSPPWHTALATSSRDLPSRPTKPEFRNLCMASAKRCSRESNQRRVLPLLRGPDSAVPYSESWLSVVRAIGPAPSGYGWTVRLPEGTDPAGVCTVRSEADVDSILDSLFLLRMWNALRMGHLSGGHVAV